MAIEPITLRSVARLGKGQTIWDVSVKGFGVRKQRQAAVYVFKYRDRSGRQRFKTIGHHGHPWTPESARAEAKQYAAMLLRSAPQTGAASSPTLREFSEVYVERYAALHKKPRTLIEDRRNLELHILPMLGQKSLADITPADVARFHASRSEWPANANRCLALLSHVLTTAAKWGAISAGVNPCRGIKRYREEMRERFLSTDEISRLGKALADAESAGAQDWRPINALRLLIYTGARLSEVLTLQWGWIHWEHGFARLPDSKTGTKNLPLPEPALKVLHEISQQHGRQSRYVFPGKRKDSHFNSIQKPWQRIRLKAHLPDVRIHDLRHCFASMAVSHGESLYLVGAVLGHRATSTTQRYAHLSMQPILDSANRVSTRIAALMQNSEDRDAP
jgi:integrase